MHGGDIYRNKVRYDFSVNTNPYGIPELVKQSLNDALAHCHEYPDPYKEDLKKAVSEFENVKESSILFGNGASELFMGICHAILPGKILIPVPSFSGYEKSAEAVTKEVTYYELQESKDFCLDDEFIDALEKKEPDLIFLANPNNPSGRLLSQGLLERIIKSCEENKILVVLDECFLDLCMEEDELRLKNMLEQFSNLMIVRAFTKNFSMPGVRLGYLLSGNPELLSMVDKQLPEWNLSCFSQAAGIAASKERDFLRRSREGISVEREFMLSELAKLPVKVFPSSSNFLLLKSAYPLYEELLKQGILIRDCADFRGLSTGFCRIAIKKRQENLLLLSALQKLFSENASSDHILI